MKIIEKISEFLDGLETKDFYKYLGIVLGIMILLISFIVYRFYRNIDYYKLRIRNLNEDREQVQLLLERAALVKQQQQEVNALLEADPNFKIGGYFQGVLTQLRLKEKELSSIPTPIERSGQAYDEVILTFKFTDMNMRELTELLDVLEQNKRIYTKELEIQKSRKPPRTIQGQLIIGTLQPRTVPAELAE